MRLRARVSSKLLLLPVSYVAYTFLPFFPIYYYFIEWKVSEFKLLAVRV
jgi:hypothetical protein